MSKKLEDYTKEELIEAIRSLKRGKKFGLVWEDKPEQVAIDCDIKLPVLQEVTDRAITKSGKQPTNLIIEGDNYHSLSTLNYTHAGKIDVIYIDPPYNTGNKDFNYNDHYVDSDDAYRHSKWLSFINKRLRLAKTLLADTGVIFISIDDNEQAHLKMLCDTIFGEENYLSTHHIQVRYGEKSLNEKKDFQELLEYVLVYAKDAKQFTANRPVEEYSFGSFNLDIKELNQPDEVIEANGRKVEIFKKGSYSIKKEKVGDIDLFKETWLSGSIYSGTGHGKTYQKIVEPRVKQDGLSTLYKIHGLGEDGLGYRYMIGPQREGSSRGKMFTKLPTVKRDEYEKGELQKARTIINYYDFAADFGNIRHEGGVGFNSGKKPVKLIAQLVNYHMNKSATVLDFFAGSGTTGHAVLKLNTEDGGKRKFILCTNNENEIAENITHKRIKNVVSGYANTEGIPANVRYFKTDFVDKQKTSDQTRLALIDRCTDMIRVREDAYDYLIDDEKLKLLSSDDHNTAIIFDPHQIEDFFKRIEEKDHEKPLNAYIFSYSSYTYDEDIPDTNLQYTLCPIPESVLEVYRRIFREVDDV